MQKNYFMCEYEDGHYKSDGLVKVYGLCRDAKDAVSRANHKTYDTKRLNKIHTIWMIGLDSIDNKYVQILGPSLGTEREIDRPAEAMISTYMAKKRRPRNSRHRIREKSAAPKVVENKQLLVQESEPFSPYKIVKSEIYYKSMHS